MQIKQLMRKTFVRVLLIVLALMLGLLGTCYYVVSNVCLDFIGFPYIEGELESRPPPIYVPDDTSRYAPQWTSDGAYIAFKPFDQRNGLVASDGSSLSSIDGSYITSISPDGSRILYNAAGGGIETSFLDGSDRQKIIDRGYDPVWSPGGGHIAFLRGTDYRKPKCGSGYFAHHGLYIANADGTKVREVFHSKKTRTHGKAVRYKSSLSWSSRNHNGLLTFVGFQKGGGEDDVVEASALYVVSYNVSYDSYDSFDMYRLFQLPLRFRGGEGDSIIGPQARSPDGRRVAFMVRDDGNLKLYTVGDSGTAPHKVIESGADGPLDPRSYLGSIAWYGSQIWFSLVPYSPGQKFSLGSSSPGQKSFARTRATFSNDGDLYVVNADGSDLHRVGEAMYFSWSPDGSRLANLTPLGSETVLTTMLPDGSDVRVLVRRRGNVTEAVGPDQRHSADMASCSAGVVVADPEENPGLVGDCEALVEMMDRLAVPELNWDADRSIGEWEGVALDDPIRREGGTYSGGSLVPLRVRGLSLPDRGMRGIIPEEVTQLDDLRSLDLSGNEFWGDIPPELERLTSLSVLNLSENYLSGTIPPELGNLSALERLNLSDNGLRTIPPELGNLSALEYLNLSENRLLGSMIPPELGNLSALKELKITHVGLRGPIPPELGNLSTLLKMDLSRNGLGGSIPPELGNLSALKYLDLFYNSLLSGPIPPELGNLSALEYLHLGHNSLGGSIPPELGNLSALKELNLRSNDLSGPIPPELGNLSALKELNLRSNDLSGPIPPELGNLSLELRLSGNDELSGCIPLALQGKVRGYRPIPRYCEQ